MQHAFSLTMVLFCASLASAQPWCSTINCSALPCYTQCFEPGVNGVATPMLTTCAERSFSCQRSAVTAAAISPVAQALEAEGAHGRSLEQLRNLAGQLSAALERGDLETAALVNMSLRKGISDQRQTLAISPKQELARLEQAAATGASGRFEALPRLAVAAWNAAEMDKAELYAREILATATSNRNGDRDGNALFYGNLITGQVALRRDGNVALARSSLLAAARTSGSPELNSFGPSMRLAKDLLLLGERDTVLEFLNLSRKFWKADQGKLDEWTATVKGGGIPDFGANLLN